MSHNHRFTAAIAGAGTGKTYSLVENYVEALFGFDSSQEKKRPQEIVALTFTEKSAHEMRLRIVKRLNELVHEKDWAHDPLMQKASCMGFLMPKSDEIKLIIRSMTNAPIATFHGFCSSLLRKYAHHFSCHDDFSIMTPKDEIMYAQNILRPILLRSIDKQDPVTRSLLARFRMLGNNLSSGILDSILEVYFKMPELGVKPKDLLHTNPRTDVQAYLNEVDKYLQFFSSIDSTASTKNRISIIAEELHSFKNIYPHGDEYVTSKSFQSLRESVKGNFGNKEARANLVCAIVNLGVKLVDSYVFEDERAVANILIEFDSEFCRFKKEASLMSYADLLINVRDGLIANHTLRKVIKNSIKHVLVDEYQDTSPLQEDLLALLLENKSWEHEIDVSSNILDRVDIRQGPTLFVVGDKKQSIYGFRGADVSLFDHMIDKLTSYQDNFIKRLLTVNRRSAAKIINLTNLVSQVTLEDQGYRPEHALHAFHEQVEGHCALWVWPKEGKDKTESNLSAAIFGIANLLATHSDIQAQDIVVLVRRIKSASRIKQGLKDFAIDARIVGGDGFFQQQEVVDVLSALKLIIDPGCELSSLVVMRSPFLLLSDQEILSIKLKIGRLDLLSLAQAHEQGILSEQSSIRFKEFADAIAWIKSNILSCCLADALHHLLLKTQFSYAIGLSDHPHQKWENIKKLGMLAIKAQGNPHDVILNLYRQISEDLKEPLAESFKDNNAVTIMTIHQSKGLEFKVVVIADSESQLPHTMGSMAVDKYLGLAVKPKNRPIARALSRDIDRSYCRTRFDQIRDKIVDREYQEMARLLYVAMTRAKEYLFIASSSSPLKNCEKNIIGLFLQAYRRFPEQFLLLCEIIEIADEKKLKSNTKLPIVDQQQVLFENKLIQKGMFASSLELECEDIPWSANEFVYTNTSIDGELAHKILASAGRMIFSSNAPISIHEAIDASLKSLDCPGSDYLESTQKAVLQTIIFLQSIVEKNDQIIFEMPLSCSPTQDLMIEGFADMVVIGRDYVGVLEFKSSLKSVTSAKTYAQVLAYANALSLIFDQPVYYSVHLIGTSKFPSWKIYDDSARNKFLHMMREFDPSAQ